MCFRLNSNTKRFPQLFSLGSTCTLIKQTSCRKFRENTTHILKIVTYWSVIHQNWMLSGPTCFLENCESWYSLIRRRSEGDLEREVAKQGPLTSESTNVWNKSIARCKYETTGFLHEREEYVFYTNRCPGLQSWPFASGSLQQLSDQISTALREHAATLHKHLEDLLLWCTWKHLEVLIHRGTWSSWGMNASLHAVNSCSMFFIDLILAILLYLDFAPNCFGGIGRKRPFMANNSVLWLLSSNGPQSFKRLW